MPGSPRWRVPKGCIRLGVWFQAGTDKVVAASAMVCAPICFDGLSFHRIRIAQGQVP